MSIDTCPSEADWGSWLGGNFTAEQSSDYEEHLMACAACLDQVRQIEPPNSLLKALGADPKITPAERHSIAQIIEKIHLRRHSESGSDPRTGLVPSSGDTFRGDVSASAIAKPPAPPESAIAGNAAPISPLTAASVELHPVSRAEVRQPDQPHEATRRDAHLATPTEAELEPGFLLGAYKLVKKLGQGGMGMVFLAEHQRMKRLVALKVLPPAVTRNAVASQRFQREVQAMARLSHPNIVTAFDADEARGLHFLVMEYVDGKDLSALVKKRGPLSIEQALDYIIQGAKGLEYAHKRGLVHRDIKPSNFLVDTEGHVKVLDLGLARFSDQAQADGADLTGTGVVAGTVDYMSPEQAEDAKSADARADIYSLGCTLWYLLAGKSVYGGETIVARLLAHQNQPIPSLRGFNPSIPEPLDRVYQKMVAKKKEQRYQTVTELLTDLAKLVPNSVNNSVPRFPPDTLRPSLSEPTLIGPQPESIPVGATWSTRALPLGKASPTYPAKVKIALASAFALALLFGVWIVLKDRNGNEIARIPVQEGNPVTFQPTTGTSVTVENTPEGKDSPRQANSKPLIQTPEFTQIPRDSTRPAPLGAWKSGPQAGWLNSHDSYDYANDPVLPGLIDTPRVIPGVKRWNVDTRIPRAIVTKVRFSPDGKLFAAGAGDGHVRVFDAATRQLRILIPGVARQQGVTDLAWHPDSRRLAIANGAIRIADLEGRVQHILKNVRELTLVTWNNAGDRLALNGLSGFHLTDADGNVWPSVVGPELTSGMIRWTPGDRTMIGFGSDGKLREFNLETRNVTVLDEVPPLIGHELAVSGDNWIAVSTGPNVRLYDPDRKMVRELTGPGGPLAWSPDGKRLFGGEFGQIWNRDTGELLARTGQQQRSCAWSPDGERLLAGTGVGLIEYNSAFQQLPVWPLRNSYVGVSYGPEGSLLVGGTPSRFLTDEGRVSSEVPAIEGVATAWCGTELLVLGPNGNVQAISPQTGQQRTLIRGPINKASAIAASRDARYIAVASPAAVALFHATGQAIRSVTTGGNGSPRLAWNPKSGRLFVCEEGQPLKWLDPETNEELQSTQGEPSGQLFSAPLVWSPDGQRLYILGQGCYDAEGRKLPNSGSFNVNAWSPDPNSKEGLVVGGQQTVLRMIDRDGNETRGRNTNGGIIGGDWHPQGHLVVTGTTQSTLTTWNSTDLLPYWTAVVLSESDIATFSAAGEFLGENADKLDSHLVYYVEREAGRIELLTPAEFRRLVTDGDKSADAPPPAIAPFDAAQAKMHQEAWAAYLKVPVEYTNSIGMKFRLIPPGEFLMGSSPEEIDSALQSVSEGPPEWQDRMRTGIPSEAPRHRVLLTQPFYLGQYEVTQAEYSRIVGRNPSHFAPEGPGQETVTGLDTAQHPVEKVSWNDAADFCARLSQLEKLKPYYFRNGENVTLLEGTGYRLPSEAEWEFACRAGTTTRYSSGDQKPDLDKAGWHFGNAGGRSHAAGELGANPFGLHDVHGNVWEWAHDGWEAGWYDQFRDTSAINPLAPWTAGSLRVIRGGTLADPAFASRSASRSPRDGTGRYGNVGFRAALSVEAMGWRGRTAQQKPPL